MQMLENNDKNYGFELVDATGSTIQLFDLAQTKEIPKFNARCIVDDARPTHTIQAGEAARVVDSFNSADGEFVLPKRVRGAAVLIGFPRLVTSVINLPNPLPNTLVIVDIDVYKAAASYRNDLYVLGSMVVNKDRVLVGYTSLRRPRLD